MSWLPTGAYKAFFGPAPSRESRELGSIFADNCSDRYAVGRDRAPELDYRCTPRMNATDRLHGDGPDFVVLCTLTAISPQD